MADDMNYDSEGYSKTLEKLVTLAEKEYYVQMVDINRHQVVVSRAILWLLVVLIGFDFAFVEWMHSKLSTSVDLFSVMVACLVIISFAITSGVIAFGFAILSIPAIGGYSKLYENSWADYANNAYERWGSEEPFVYETEMSTLLGKIDSACSFGSKTNQNRGVKLRIASILAIISAVFTCITFIVFSFGYYL
ncbi:MULTISPECIES: hypothetical protein [Vibrio harveyi group]|uniref:hypothetical protein n=1 Tax=Vibrio harveyi group TaxID=717610 RepID=UPI000C3D6BC5|nr:MULTISPECIES: hypothetical protein [Vibrio harveyi group]PIB14621.1 hypothetical protein B853_15874 [Vibrio rotiferianus CAIM 577 = LMG 21460]WDZ72026.1 hypothetical protein PWW31_13460 [Vibrio harveyi]HDM8069717.1 hypothetical protein [Vibrio harveyi]